MKDVDEVVVRWVPVELLHAAVPEEWRIDSAEIIPWEPSEVSGDQGTREETSLFPQTVEYIPHENPRAGGEGGAERVKRGAGGWGAGGQREAAGRRCRWTGERKHVGAIAYGR